MNEPCNNSFGTETSRAIHREEPAIAWVAEPTTCLRKCCATELEIHNSQAPKFFKYSVLLCTIMYYYVLSGTIYICLIQIKDIYLCYRRTVAGDWYSSDMDLSFGCLRLGNRRDGNREPPRNPSDNDFWLIFNEPSRIRNVNKINLSDCQTLWVICTHLGSISSMMLNLLKGLEG